MKKFSAQNIKCFNDTGEIEFKPITIFIGKNSSGKSSLIRFPLVLKQTIKEKVSPLLFYGDTIDYGNFEDVVIDHDKKKEISFSFSLVTKGALSIRDRFDEMDVHVSVRKSSNLDGYSLEISSFQMFGDKNEIVSIRANNTGTHEVKLFNDKIYKANNIHFDGFVPRIYMPCTRFDGHAELK